MPRSPRRAGPEALLLRSVLQALAYMRGVHALRLNAGLTLVGDGASRRAIKGAEPGTPDVLVMLPAERCVWLELKAPKGRLSESQRVWHERARELGQVVHVVRSVDEAMAAVKAAQEAKACR